MQHKTCFHKTDTGMHHSEDEISMYRIILVAFIGSVCFKHYWCLNMSTCTKRENSQACLTRGFGAEWYTGWRGLESYLIGRAL